jgi:hypothetical protein
MRSSIRIAVVSVCVALVSAVSATAAVAAPTNVAEALFGTADCGPDGTFDFVVNSGNSEATTWGPAFVTTSDGATALFIPSSFDLTFTSPWGTETETATKHSGPGPVTCEISANPAPGFSLSGSVTGTLVWTG